MATEIKRVRFFDGQFLKQLEFQEEQAYHMHLRRRMNYFLFGQSGVVSIGADDLKLVVVSAPDKTFLVRAGMAICQRSNLQEGKEIVLFADSAPIDLDSLGFSSGTAWVTLNWEETEAKDPASEGDVDENTRYKETGRIQVHTSLPPTTLPNGEQLILLGTIDYATMTVDHSTRHEAKLRGSLLPVAVVPAPVITGLTGTTTLTVGGAPATATIQGTNLANASSVGFSDPAVTAIITNSNATSVSITVVATGAATTGTKTFTVTTPGGTANSPGGVTFNVVTAVPAPTISGISPTSLQQGASAAVVQVMGQNLGSQSDLPTLAFSGAGITANVYASNGAVAFAQVTVTSGAATGPRTFTVTTAGGQASSGPVTLTVTAPPPPVQLLSLQPSFQASGGTIQIHGNNIRDPNLAALAAATGTTVQLSKGAVNVAALNPTVLSNVSGHQVVRVTIPPRPGAWGINEAVTLTLTFNGSPASLPFTYDD